MPQAIVDPAELRRFAQNLKRFNEELQGQMAALHGQLNHLGASWRDKEHDKFVEEFEQTMTVVARFVDATSQHIPFLMRKAEKIDDYLQQR
jgi:WXG100 family type VII secretion target